MDDKIEKREILMDLGVRPFRERTYHEYESDEISEIKSAAETLKKYEIFDEKDYAMTNELYQSQCKTISQIKKDFETFLVYFVLLFGGMGLTLLINQDLRNFSFIWKYSAIITVIMLLVARDVLKRFRINDFRTKFISENYYNS